MNQGPGDRRSLLLAAAQLMHEMGGAIRQADKLEKFFRPCRRLVRRNALKEQGQTHIFERIHRREEIEKLEDESELTAAKVGQLRVVRGR